MGEGTKLTEFTVDRATWLRGEGAAKSRLVRRQDDKQCCLGFLCRAAGLPKKALLSQAAPEDLAPELKERLPAFLFEKLEKSPSALRNSGAAANMMRVNDSGELTEEERELKLTRLFERQGIKVTFKGRKRTAK